MYRCTSGHINESRSIPQVVEVFIDEELSPLSVLWWTEARNQLLAWTSSRYIWNGLFNGALKISFINGSIAFGYNKMTQMAADGNRSHPE